ncbi:MAG: acetate uptake transporter [Candidatus Thermoplasmatota archaeon]|jgi:succinate-acetate transporter protein|nr:acetate uptake transporter [Candidatus Thermoplasmatota archaeon]
MEQKNILANPAPLGLMGFGMTTVLLNIHNAVPTEYKLTSMILAMGIFYGGLAQIIAGILEYRRGNTFGVTAFTSYGLFWLSLVGILIIPEIITSGTYAVSTTKPFLAWYFFMWGFFTMMMFIGALKKNCSLSFVFGSLFILFYLLALRDWGYITGDAANLIGYEGIICGLSAIYLAMAEVLNEVYGKTILPIGKPLIK